MSIACRVLVTLALFGCDRWRETFTPAGTAWILEVNPTTVAARSGEQLLIGLGPEPVPGSSGGGRVAALARADGAVRWTRPVAGHVGPRQLAVGAGGDAFVTWANYGGPCGRAQMGAADGTLVRAAMVPWSGGEEYRGDTRAMVVTSAAGAVAWFCRGLVRVEGPDGVERWSLTLPEELSPALGMAIGDSGDLVVCSFYRVARFRGADGRLLWTRETDGGGCDLVGDRVIIGMGARALDAEGKMLWSASLGVNGAMLRGLAPLPGGDVALAGLFERRAEVGGRVLRDGNGLVLRLRGATGEMVELRELLLTSGRSSPSEAELAADDRGRVFAAFSRWLLAIDFGAAP